MIKVLFALLKELMVNGKSIVAFIMLQWPGLSDYPGIASALQALGDNPSKQNLINLAWQLLFAGAAGHRLIKIIKEKLNK